MKTISHVVALVVILGGCALGAAACSSDSNPVSPDPALSATTTADGARTVVGLTGVVRNLNVRTQTFTLATRAGSRTVRADGRTEVWQGGTRIRFSSLRDGLAVGVRGTDEGRYVQALTVSVLR
jgi:hypothetical protein